VSVSVFAVFIVLVVNAFLNINKYKSDLIEKSTINTQIIGESLIAPLEFEQVDAQKKVLNKFSFTNNIILAAVFNTEDTLLTYYGEGKLLEKIKPAEIPGMLSFDDYIVINYLIKYENKSLGTLVTVTSMDEYYHEIANYIIFLFFVMILVAALAYLLARFLQKYITDPIISLTQAAKNFDMLGNLSVRALPSPNDEIGTLVHEFNSMLDRLMINERERKQYEMELKKNKLELEKAQRLAKVGSWSWDHKTGHLNWSDEMYNIFEVPKNYPKELLKSKFIELIQKSDLRLGNTINNNSNHELKIKTESGKIKYLKINGDIFKDDETTSQSGTFQDITEIILVQNKLRISKIKFENIFNTVPISLWELDYQKSFEYIERNCNNIDEMENVVNSDIKVFYKLLKLISIKNINQNSLELFSAASVHEIKERFFDCIPEDSLDILKIELLRVLKGKNQVEFLMDFNTLSGKRINTIVKINHLDSAQNSKNVLMSIIDITEQRILSSEKNKLLEEISGKNEELEQIIYVASHDLRSPLVNIYGFSEELEESITQIQELAKTKIELADTDKKILEIINEDLPLSLNFIKSSANKIDSLLKGLLKLSRLGRAALHIEKVDLNKLIQGIVQGLQFQLKEVDADLQIEKLYPCRGDSVQLNQVFTNILDNAIKYRKKNVPLRIRIYSILSSNNTIIYCVEDNGIGIAKEHAKKIFELFHRLHLDSEVIGEGLGLTIVKRILQRHYGKIWVESNTNGGAKFFIELPRY